LRHLAISHLPIKPETHDIEEEAAAELAFANVFADLPNLETLSFESCDRLSEHMLLHLPRTLKTVKFINCMPLDSDSLISFLDSHGHSYATFQTTLPLETSLTYNSQDPRLGP